MMKRIKNSKILKNIRYFVPLLFKLNPFAIVSNVIVAILNSISSLCWIYFPKEIIELLTNKGENQKEDLIKIVIIFVSLQFIINVLSNLNYKIREYACTKADFVIDKMFNNKIAMVDYFNIEDPEFSDKITLAKKGLSQYSNGIYSILFVIEGIITNIITLSGVIAIVVSSGELIVIILAILGIIVNSIVYSKYTDLDQEYNSSFVRHHRKQWYFNDAMMSFRNQKNLRLYNSEDLIDKKSNEINDTVISEKKKTNKKMKRLQIGESFYYMLITRFITIVILGYAVYNKNMSIAVFTMLFSAIETFDGGVSNLIYTIKTYSKDCNYQSDFIDIMNIKPINKDGVIPIKEINSIEFRNVCFKYPRTENYILDNISFKIEDSQKVSLVGLNGAGKTTMIKLLCRFFELEEGEILVNGRNIKEYKYDEYMREIAVVFQDYKIISYTIKDNVSIDDDNKEKLYDCFKRSQVLDKVESLPKKENTYINKWFDPAGVEFSGGEMQKFAISRALYKDSSFVILDEPTSALDPVSEAEIYYHFNEVIGKKLTLFISHRLSSCIFSDKILVLDGAKIVEEGKHEDLIKNTDGLYSKMFNAQAKYYK